MLKYTRTALGLLNNQYRSVLRKCALINLGIFALALPANAETITIDLAPTLGADAAYSWGSSNVFKLDPIKTVYSIDTASGSITSTEQSLNITKTTYEGEITNIGVVEQVNGTMSYTYNNWSNGGTPDPKSIIVTFNPVNQNIDSTNTEGKNVDINRYNYHGSSGYYVVNNNITDINAYITGFTEPIVDQTDPATTYRGAILVKDKNVNSITGGFVGNIGWRGIYVENSNINSISADFIANSLIIWDTTNGYGVGGGIYAADGAKIGSVTGDFILNTSQGNTNVYGGIGGAIFISKGASFGDINGNFIKNSVLAAERQKGGGAIFNGGTVTSITGNFIANSAEKRTDLTANSDADGGAILNWGTIKNIDANFIGNTANSDSASGYANGGAIVNHSSSDDDGNVTVASIEKITGLFAQNETAGSGGAIINRGGDLNSDIGSIIGSIDATFIANKASNGAAIYNGASTDHIGEIKGTFIENIATYIGGAIFNGRNINSIDAIFNGNTAEDRGGAIYNNGIIQTIGGTFEANEAENGAAIYNRQDIDTISAIFSNNVSENNVIYNSGNIELITNSTFADNDSLTVIENTSTIGKITNSSFTNNSGYAVKTDSDLLFEAQDGYQSIFQGNNSENESAVFSVGDDVTLTFNALSGGEFYMYDSLNSDNRYGLQISGDKSGTFHLYNDAVNGDIAVEDSILEIGAYGIDTGSISFSPDATLALTINTIDEYGSIHAGAIDIAEGATLQATIADSLKLKPFTSYELTILSSDTDFTNNFSDTISNDAYTFTKKQGAEGVYEIVWKPKAEDLTRDMGGTINNQDTAKGWMDNGRTDTIANQLWDLTQSGDKKLLDELTAIAPNDAPMVQGVMVEVNDRLFKAVNSHLLNDSLGKRNTPQGFAAGDGYGIGLSLWADVYFGKSELDDRSGDDGTYYGFDTDSKGVIIGLDYYHQYTKAGIGYQHDSTDVDAFKRDVDVDTDAVYAYVEYKPNQWYSNLVVSYNMAEFDEEKHPFDATYNAKYDVDDLALQAMTGYEIITPGVDITPQAGIRYHHLNRDGYTDTLGQEVSSKDMNILTAVGGIKIAKDFALENCNKFRPEAYVGVTYDLISDRDNSTVIVPNGAVYNIQGKILPRFGIEAGVGATAAITDNLSLHANYYGGFRSDYQNHTGMVGLKYAF